MTFVTQTAGSCSESEYSQRSKRRRRFAGSLTGVMRASRPRSSFLAEACQRSRLTQRRKDRKDAKARPNHLTRLCVFAIFVPLRERFLEITPCSKLPKLLPRNPLEQSGGFP